MHCLGAQTGSSAATFVETNGFPAVSGPLDGFRAQHGHAFEVPRQAHQRPFVAHVLQPAQQELAELHHRLDDAEHRLHRLLAWCVGGAPTLGLERVLYLLDAAGRFGDAPSIAERSSFSTTSTTYRAKCDCGSQSCTDGGNK